jgi:putative FmdB family regulatory protein
MPLYNYSCSTCGATFERQMGFNENPIAIICPNGHHKVRRIYTAPSIIFKGTGWYSTEHRGNKKGIPNSSEENHQ